jgi:hypothetical protein
LVEATNDIARAERDDGQLFANDLEHSLICYVFDPLDRTVNSLQIGANFRLTVFERSIEDRATNGFGRTSVPDFLERVLLDVSDRFGNPILTAEKHITTLSAAAENLKAGKRLGAKQPLRILFVRGTSAQRWSGPS